MKQHTTPVVIEGKKTHSLKRVSFDSKDFNESWIQEICFENTGIIPFDEIEPTFEGMIPICRELSTKAGFVDLIYLNEYGFIAIGV